MKENVLKRYTQINVVKNTTIRYICLTKAFNLPKKTLIKYFNEQKDQTKL
jgi:hypothetical protein